MQNTQKVSSNDIRLVHFDSNNNKHECVPRNGNSISYYFFFCRHTRA